MNRTGRIKIGVIGVGHLGKHHVKHLSEISEANLIGVFDMHKKAYRFINVKTLEQIKVGGIQYIIKEK